MTLNDIEREVSRGAPPRIEVHSVELALFVAYSIHDGRKAPVTHKRGKTLNFPSRYAALRAFKATGLTQLEMVHVSPYDEMIGVPSTPGQSEMREVIELADVREA